MKLDNWVWRDFPLRGLIAWLGPPVFHSAASRTVSIQFEAPGHLLLKHLVGIVDLRDCTQRRLVGKSVGSDGILGWQGIVAVQEAMVLPLRLCVLNGLGEKGFGSSIQCDIVGFVGPDKSKVHPCDKIVMLAHAFI